MEKKNYFELISAQRYFHLVAFKTTRKYGIDDYYKDFHLLAKKERHTRYEHEDFIIDHARVTTNISYYGGEKDYSVNNDGQAPYHYDLFTIELPRLQLLVFGFPFKYLAKDIITQLIEDRKFLQFGSFVKIDLNKLIKETEDYALHGPNFTSNFSGLDLQLTGDSNVSNVNLDGDKPLDSTVYKSYFYELVQKDECKLERCSLKCELQSDSTNYPKTKSNIHLDLFGNYKLYIHGSGNNVFTIPSIFRSFFEQDLVKLTLGNRISRLQDE